MRFRTRWRIWSQICRTWSRLIRPGRPNPVLVAFQMEIGARVAAADSDHSVEGFTTLRISGCSVALSMPSRPWPGRRRRSSVSAAGTAERLPADCHNQSHNDLCRIGSGGASLKSVCRITNLEESLSRKTTIPLPARPLAPQPERRRCRRRRGRGRGVWGGGGAKRRDQS